MSPTLLLLLVAVILPFVWGWAVYRVVARWWPPSPAESRRAPPDDARATLSDYQI